MNVWAEFFSAAPELDYYRPYTSKDIDYFGQAQAAEKLAQALGGTLSLPEIDDHTPSTALVKATVDGVELEIDFLNNVSGVKHEELERKAAEVLVPNLAAPGGFVEIPVMHPLHCLESRIVNLIKHGRKDDTAIRQAEAAPVVLREFVNRLLSNGEQRHGLRTLKGLYQFLRQHPEGKRAHKYVKRDPLEVLQHFRDDQRLDERYRDKTLIPMIEDVRHNRSAIQRILDAIALKKRPVIEEDEASG